MESWVSDKMPAAMEEQFFERVLAFETAPMTTSFKQLGDAAVPLPNPDDVSDADITATLWAVINGLARLDVFLRCTDHLSDRDLYAVLWKDVLREEIPLLPKHSRGVWHIDMPGAAPDGIVYLKYYASEKHRGWWREDFPDYEMPAHEEPPYDRDRHLPTPVDEEHPTTRH